MEQRELFEQTDDLFGQLCSKQILWQAFKAVKANKGSPGVDGITIEVFESRLEEELTRLQKELQDWSYKPSPVRRVEIPKPNGGVRLLGVPNIRDRVVQTGMKLLLEPIFDPGFSDSSYGFRPGKNQRQAIEAAQGYVKEGKEYIVDIDLSKFFDRINHDRMLSRVKLKVQDKRIIRLIGLTLRSGVLTDGVVVPTEEGTTQGSPVSPLLSNIVLDELDKELETRGLSFCRFADDCNIFMGSKKAADRVMEGVTELIEKKMKLVVNREKSKVALSSAVKFLGMTIIMGAVTISSQAMDKAMVKVKELVPRGSNQPIEKAIEKFNRWYKGWSSYFDMTQYPSQFVKIESHARRRFRARMIRNLKRRRNIARFIVKSGLNKKTANRVYYSHKSWWALSHDQAFDRIFSNKWFEEQGFYVKSSLAKER